MSAPDPITRFLDLRALWGGGDLASQVQLRQWTGGNAYQDHNQYVELSPGELQSFIFSRDVLIATHGFNVNRADGIQTLSQWRQLLTLPDSAVFLGLLWPGDSESFHALSYPAEPAHAVGAGDMAAGFIDQNFGNATSISFVSHSLGARVILQAITTMKRRPVRRAVIMAGAVDDHCLNEEFSAVPPKVKEISVLASKEDEVLRWAFPVGDFVAEIVDRSHPWWESALGRFGPAQLPEHYQPPCQIPKEWKYGHGDYLRIDPPASSPIPPECGIPPPKPLPQNDAPGWQEAWSAAFVSCRFQ
jgi:hypothetical protein